MINLLLKLDRAKRVITKLQAELARLRDAYKDSQKQLARLRAQLERGKAHAQERLQLVQENKDAEAENERLREQLNDCTASHQRQNAEVERLDAELARLRDDWEEHTRLNNKCIADLNAYNARLREEVRTLATEIERLRALCAKQEDEIDEWAEKTGRQYPGQVTYTQEEARFWQTKAELYATQRDEARNNEQA